MKNSKGFTLIEIMIVVGIISVLMSIVAWNIYARAQVMKEQILDAQFKKLSDAVYQFYGENGQFPNTLGFDGLGGISVTWKDIGFKKDLSDASEARGAYTFVTVPDSGWFSDPPDADNNFVILAYPKDTNGTLWVYESKVSDKTKM